MIIRCSSIGEVVRAVCACSTAGTRWIVMGAGTNVVFSDEGLRVPALSLSGELTQWDVDLDGVEAGGGANLTHLVRAVTRSGLEGAVELFGIPGSVGGAAVMNAGAHGVQMSDLIEWLEVVEPDGEVHRLSPQNVTFGYRRTSLAEDRIVVRVRLALNPGHPGRMQARLRQINRERRERLPTGRSAGSVFKNPEEDAAGRLLEAAGCKGLRRGGARVSEKHANVIVVSAGAKARDVTGLAGEMRRRVRQQHNVDLQPEVWFLDENGERFVP